MTNQVKALFGGVPKDLDRFIFASQAVQAEAMKYFVEFWRMDKFRRTGIIWWNLRDGWPILSDAIVDFYNSRKLAYYFIRRVQPDACVMIGDARDGKHPVIAVNDTREDKKGTVLISVADTGETLFASSFEIPANGRTEVGEIPARDGQAMWLIESAIGETRLANHYLAGHPPFQLDDYECWYKKLDIRRD
jgi:beta-mannosidase